MRSGGTKFQCDSSSENHLSGSLAPNDGSHPVIQNTEWGWEGTTYLSQEEAARKGLDGRKWQLELVSSLDLGLVLQRAPPALTTTPCPHCPHSNAPGGLAGEGPSIPSNHVPQEVLHPHYLGSPPPTPPSDKSECLLSVADALPASYT